MHQLHYQHAYGTDGFVADVFWNKMSREAVEDAEVNPISVLISSVSDLIYSTYHQDR